MNTDSFSYLFRTNFCVRNRADVSVGSLLFLSPEEAGLLLGDTVFPLSQRELGPVPPAVTEHTGNSLAFNYERQSCREKTSSNSQIPWVIDPQSIKHLTSSSWLLWAASFHEQGLHVYQHELFCTFLPSGREMNIKFHISEKLKRLCPSKKCKHCSKI